MKSFAKFLKERNNQQSGNSSQGDNTLAAIQMSIGTQIAAITSPLLGSSIASQEFSKEVSALVQSEEFMSEVSNCIDEPLENETEEEFVDRASDALRKLLYKKFGL